MNDPDAMRMICEDCEEALSLDKALGDSGWLAAVVLGSVLPKVVVGSTTARTCPGPGGSTKGSAIDFLLATR